MQTITPFIHLCRMGAALGIDLVRFLGVSLRSRTALAAENLFLRKQLALYREGQVQPRRASDPVRLGLVLLAQCFAWREVLAIVQPATLLRWRGSITTAAALTAVSARVFRSPCPDFPLPLSPAIGSRVTLELWHDRFSGDSSMSTA
jgi:putative transposase